MFFGCSPCCGGGCIDYDKFTSFHIEATASLKHIYYNFFYYYTPPSIDVEIPIVADFNRTPISVNAVDETSASYLARFSYDAGTGDIPVSLGVWLSLQFFGRRDNAQVLNSYEIGLKLFYSPYYFPGYPASASLGHLSDAISFTHYPCGDNSLPTENYVTYKHDYIGLNYPGVEATIVSTTLDGSTLSGGPSDVLTGAPFYGRPDLLIQGDPIKLTRSHISRQTLTATSTVLNGEIGLSVETAIGINDDGTFEPLSPYWFGNDRVIL